LFQGPTCCVLKQGGGQMKHKIHIRVCPVCSSGAVEDAKHLIFECPSYDEIRSKIRFSHIFKELSSLSSVLQESSPLVCEFLS
jgi:hypothetical protein